MDYINELHSTLLEILDFVVNVCEKNNFTYCLLYGTALGAYRHKGFIPWDDDLDIGIPREDYTKFIEYLKNNPSPYFSLQNEDNEVNWGLTFVKVRKNNTVFIESYARNNYKNNGVFIDVFPLDGLIKKDKLFKVKKIYINYIKHTLKIKAFPSLFKTKKCYFLYILDRMISWPNLIFSTQKLLKHVNKIMSANCYSEKIKYILQYDESSDAAIMEKEIYFPLQKCLFEGKEYYVPGNIEEYLRRQYGNDFMELPPIEKRMTHKPIKVEF